MRSVGTWLFVSIALASAAGCESQAAPTPEVRARAAQPAQGTSTPEQAPSSAGAHVDLAKYQVPGAAPGTASSTAAVADLANAGSPAAASDAPPAGKAEARKGAVVSEEAFSAWLQADSPLAAGALTHIEAVLVANPPYHCNAEYPHKFKLNAAPPGLTYPEEVVRGMQVSAARGVLRIPVQAKAAGAAAVSGTLSFSVCTEERCMVEKRDLTLNLDVK
jgi:hypothetical protein